MKKPDPWQAIGNDLMQQLRELHTDLGVRVPRLPEFSKTIYSYIHGDHTKLAKYLRAHQLSLGEQAELAWALEERAKPKMGAPESIEHVDQKMLANVALHFYQIWKKTNHRRGASDYGHSAEMRDQVCKFIVDLYDPAADASAVAALLTQPKSRRKY